MASTREAYGTWDINIGVTLASAREGTGVWDENIGVTLASAREGTGIWDENIGVTLASAREGTGVWDENVRNLTPTPHVWYLYPNYGREGWEFVVVGHGFGASQATFNGAVKLGPLVCTVIAWALIAATADPPSIDEAANQVTIEHGEIRVAVPTGAVSGLVQVSHDGP